MDYALKRRTSDAFDAVTEAVERSIGAHGFVVAGSHDMHVTLAHKGFRIHPVRIYELRDPAAGRRAREVGGVGEFGPDVMPGRISVFVENGDVVVAAVKPGVVTDMFPEAGLDAAARELERRIVRVVEDAVDGPIGELEGVR